MDKVSDIVHFAYNDLKPLFIILIIFTIISSFLIYLLTSPSRIELKFLFSNWVIDASAGLALLSTLVLILRERKRKSKGKKYVSLFIGVLLWFAAEILYTYFQTILKIDIPYPSYADILWFLGYIFVGYHIYSAFNFWNQNKKFGENAVFIITIFTALLVHLLVQTSVTTYSSDMYLIMVDILYHILDGAILIPSFILLWNLRFDHHLFIHRSLISLFVILNTFGNIGFIFSFNSGQNSAVEFAWIWDIIYNFSYIVLAGTLFWYDKLLDIINKKIEQNMILNKEHFQYSIGNQNKHKIITTNDNNLHKLIDKEKINDNLNQLVDNAKSEILLLIFIQNQYQFNLNKSLNLLIDHAKGNKNIKIRILYDNPSNLTLVLTKNYYDLPNIIFKQISKILEYDSIAILIDHQYLIILNMKNYMDFNELTPIYSTSNNNILQFSNLFESLWTLSELKEHTTNKIRN